MEQGMSKQTKYRLCYVSGDDGVYQLWFTDRFDTQWGDDWDDSPAYCNAGDPYEWCNDDECTHSDGYGVIVRMCVSGNCESTASEIYSVKQINNGCAPWIVAKAYSHDMSGLQAGVSLDEAIEWSKKNGLHLFLEEIGDESQAIGVYAGS